MRPNAAVRLRDSPDGEVYVVDDDGAVGAVIGYADVDIALTNEVEGAPLDAAAIAQPLADVLVPADTLEAAQEKVAAAGPQVPRRCRSAPASRPGLQSG